MNELTNKIFTNKNITKLYIFINPKLFLIHTFLNYQDQINVY